MGGHHAAYGGGDGDEDDDDDAAADGGGTSSSRGRHASRQQQQQQQQRQQQLAALHEHEPSPFVDEAEELQQQQQVYLSPIHEDEDEEEGVDCECRRIDQEQLSFNVGFFNAKVGNKRVCCGGALGGGREAKGEREGSQVCGGQRTRDTRQE